MTELKVAERQGE